MQDSVFTKIIKGEIPSFKIYEDSYVVAFLDIHPIAPGHTLIVPKAQVEFLWDLNDEQYTAVMSAVKQVALHLRTTLSVPYVGEQVIGVDVPHAHVHLIPFTTAHEYHNNPDVTAEPDFESLAAIAKRLQIK
ncbi:MAG TPA: HIT domain-containing protein [Candidatus Saccharimonadales bacterium]|nr:HIT domain-containing protein [Candidatus Saccharimonadales bacterium]